MQVSLYYPRLIQPKLCVKIKFHNHPQRERITGANIILTKAKLPKTLLLHKDSVDVLIDKNQNQANYGTRSPHNKAKTQDKTALPPSCPNRPGMKASAL